EFRALAPALDRGRGSSGVLATCDSFAEHLRICGTRPVNMNQSREERIGATVPTWFRSAPAVGRVWSRTGLALGVIITLALALRVGGYLESPRPVEGAGLAATQAEMARNIVDRGKWFVVNPKATKLLNSRQIELNRLVDPKELDLARLDRSTPTEPEIAQMPGVALVLAALWWPTGNETYAPLQWLQLLLDTLMVLLVYWIGSRLTRNVHVSLLAALLYAIWPAAIVVDRRPVLDTWAIFFTIGSVAAFVWARERPSSRWRLISVGL